MNKTSGSTEARADAGCADIPQPRRDARTGQRYYTVAEAMQLEPKQYENWVYSSQTEKVDEVRLYPTSPFWNGVFTKSPPFLPLVFWPPIIYWILTPLTWTKAWWVLVGLILWFPIEYLFHRFLFHLPVSSPFTRKLHFMLHGIHHVAPTDLWHVWSPPYELGAQAVAVWCCFWLLGLPDPTSLVAGLLINYLRYDLIHYCCHAYTVETLAKVPWVGSYLRKCKVHHMAHHYVNPRNHFTISYVSSLVD